MPNNLANKTIGNAAIGARTPNRSIPILLPANKSWSTINEKVRLAALNKPAMAITSPSNWIFVFTKSLNTNSIMLLCLDLNEPPRVRIALAIGNAVAMAINIVTTLNNFCIPPASP